MYYEQELENKVIFFRNCFFKVFLVFGFFIEIIVIFVKNIYKKKILEIKLIIGSSFINFFE